METQCQHLTIIKCNELLELLQRFEVLFNVMIGTSKKYPEDFKLKEDTKLICSRPYPILKVHKKMFKKEVERLVLLGVLELSNDWEWGGAYPFYNLNLNQIE